MKEYICKEVPTDNGGYLEPVKELIQCKDCKYSKMTIRGDSAKYCLKWEEEFDFMDSLYLPADFYCGFAERKEE